MSSTTDDSALLLEASDVRDKLSNRPLESVQEETDPGTFVDDDDEEEDDDEKAKETQDNHGDDKDRRDEIGIQNESEGGTKANTNDAGLAAVNGSDDENANGLPHGLVATDEDDMPLLKYRRLAGNLPRTMPADGNDNDTGMKPFTHNCTSTALGRVVLPPEVNNSGASSSAAGAAGLPSPSVLAGSGLSGNNNNSNNNNKGAGNNGNSRNDPRLDHPFYVMAAGFANGQVLFVDMETGANIIKPKQLREGMAGGKDPIVDVSVDSSGGYLAAINAKGICTVWEIKYTRSLKQEAEENVFSSFLTSLAGQQQQQQGNSGNTKSKSGETGDNTAMTILQTLSVQPSKTNYPWSFGKPTCMIIDPSYKRRREKALVVGFADGRLMLTKKGFFNRRTDSVVYQTAKGPESRGIEALAWRGPLVAWADYT